ncbi:MAG: hypothetical protein N838_21335 [Thiohalocapsa sp. PB-PSB1]|nr:MAG: hypothetical protein N838_21335 [Thiohalocapsa sp. PB-PSB1]
MGGQDKGLLEFAGRPLVEWVIDRLRPQVRGLVINANRNRDRYATYGYPVITDATADFQGPLSGIASALMAVHTRWIIIAPCDGPYLAMDLVERLRAALRHQDGELAVASDGQRIQQVYALIPKDLAPSLDTFLASGERKVGCWYARHRTAIADFSDSADCFANINSARDIEGAPRPALPDRDANKNALRHSLYSRTGPGFPAEPVGSTGHGEISGTSRPLSARRRRTGAQID